MKRVLLLIIMTPHIIHAQTPSWKPGLESASKEKIQQMLPHIKNPRIGLITNQTGKSLKKQRNVDVLLRQKINITTVFVPEHGLHGSIPAEKAVLHGIDRKTKLPIVSLYKGHGFASIDQDYLDNIDAFMFDMQDSGMRHYTYLSTLYHTMEIAAAHNKPFIILDRPNPLGGVMEGPLVDNDVASFISIAPIPVRHGLTLAELARYFNTHVLAQHVTLKIIPMQHYQRQLGINNVWLAPLSPNIQKSQACYGYCFLGMLSEIQPFDMAIGTPHAFRCLLLPESLHIPRKKWIALSLQLEKYDVYSQAYRYFNKKKKQWYVGLFFNIYNPHKVPAIKTMLAITDFFKKEGIQFTFRNFDKATGTTKVRLYIDDKISRKELAHSINKDLKNFYAQAQPILLYKPAPQIVLL
jgi:uncharacterized protein YbbC (DUF1343 family)